ncbi:putative nuclease HARBI1 [Pecten maximus]|uniref:putative nuclease HARBI1 n=1 Tax=Pecten maximus TaxID=6579 RepID=UPI00145886CC|nr:putative nuclease HARBI1 [Pecten maximus]
MAYGTVIAVLMEESGEDDDEEDDFFILGACTALLSREKRSRISGYVDMVVPEYNKTEFRRMFRMSPQTFDILSGYLENCPELQKEGTGGKVPVSVRTQLLLTLWYVGGLDTIIKIADRFGLSESTVILSRTRIIGAILHHLKERFICWPVNQQDVVTKFVQRNGFPGIIGALDGTHIRIKAPQLHPQSYVNRKNFHSIQLQAVCNSDMMFTHCMAGFPGKCHDARVLKNSDLWDDGLHLCQNNHIIADAAYPLRRWLLTPYRDNGHLTQEQKNYNYKHSANRVVIEMAFSLLKGRFRRLQNLETNKVETSVNVIMACCVLHNVCLAEEDEIDEFLQEEDGDDNPAPHPVFIENNGEGLIKRNAIARNLH